MPMSCLFGPAPAPSPPKLHKSTAIFDIEFVTVTRNNGFRSGGEKRQCDARGPTDQNVLLIYRSTDPRVIERIIRCGEASSCDLQNLLP